jgi:hypothetical protein
VGRILLPDRRAIAPTIIESSAVPLRGSNDLAEISVRLCAAIDRLHDLAHEIRDFVPSLPVMSTGKLGRFPVA